MTFQEFVQDIEMLPADIKAAILKDEAAFVAWWGANGSKVTKILNMIAGDITLASIFFPQVAAEGVAAGGIIKAIGPVLDSAVSTAGSQTAIGQVQGLAQLAIGMGNAASNNLTGGAAGSAKDLTSEVSGFMSKVLTVATAVQANAASVAEPIVPGPGNTGVSQG